MTNGPRRRPSQTTGADPPRRSSKETLGGRMMLLAMALPLGACAAWTMANARAGSPWWPPVLAGLGWLAICKGVVLVMLRIGSRSLRRS